MIITSTIGLTKQTFQNATRLRPRGGVTISSRAMATRPMSGVVQQYNVVKREEVHLGTPPLKVVRMLLALATSKDAHRRKVCGIWNVSVAFFHCPMDEYTVVRPLRRGLRVKGKLRVLNRALNGTRMASRFFGNLVAEVLTNALFETASFVPNTYHHRQ